MLINLKGIRNAQLRGSGMDEGMLARYQKEMVEEGALPGGINWYRAFRYFADVPNITVPTTHIWGRHDNSLEERGAQLNSQFIDAPYEFRIIEDGNHWLPDQNAPEVAQSVLARVRSVA